MGAHNFETVIYTTASMEDAYHQAVADALHDAGHDPYNGTISTTSGVRLSPLATGKPLPDHKIDYSALGERLDYLSKWEDCEALPILRSIPAERERVGTVDVDVTVPSELFDSGPYEPKTLAALEAAATTEVRKRIRSTGKLETHVFGKDSMVTPVPGDAKEYEVSFMGQALIVQQPKASTRATKGKTETRYFIINPKMPTLPDWEQGHATQAAARAALPTALSRSAAQWRGRESFSIIAMTRRTGGEALVEHTVDARAGARTKVRVGVTVHRLVKPAQVTDEAGWLFYGWAAC